MRRPGGPPPDARLGRGSRLEAERGAGRARATASVEAQLAAASITPEPRDEELARPPGGRARRRSSAAATSIDATAIDAMVQPLVDEVERLQLRIRALEREVSEERQRGRATEKRMLAHVQALLSKRTNAGDDAAGAFALPPAGHPFWRQPEAPATAIRMLADAEAARARCAAQLEAADELQRNLAAQVDTLQAKNRALTSAAMSMEMAGTARRA